MAKYLGGSNTQTHVQWNFVVTALKTEVGRLWEIKESSHKMPATRVACDSDTVLDSCCLTSMTPASYSLVSSLVLHCNTNPL